MFAITMLMTMTTMTTTVFGDDEKSVDVTADTVGRAGANDEACNNKPIWS